MKKSGLSDEHRNAIHLGERDGSMQRRYQKVIVIEGTKTNIPLQQELFKDPAFRAGGTNIHYLEKKLEEKNL